PHVAGLSVEVETVLVLPAASETPPAGIDAITVPLVVIPLTARLKVLLSALGFVIVTVFVPPAVPPIVTSEATKVDESIGSLNTAVKLIGAVFVGSGCP